MASRSYAADLGRAPLVVDVNLAAFLTLCPSRSVPPSGGGNSWAGDASLMVAVMRSSDENRYLGCEGEVSGLGADVFPLSWIGVDLRIGNQMLLRVGYTLEIVSKFHLAVSVDTSYHYF